MSPAAARPMPRPPIVTPLATGSVRFSPSRGRPAPRNRAVPLRALCKRRANRLRPSGGGRRSVMPRADPVHGKRTVVAVVAWTIPRAEWSIRAQARTGPRGSSREWKARATSSPPASSLIVPPASRRHFLYRRLPSGRGRNRIALRFTYVRKPKFRLPGICRGFYEV